MGLSAGRAHIAGLALAGHVDGVLTPAPACLTVDQRGDVADVGDACQGLSSIRALQFRGPRGWQGDMRHTWLQAAGASKRGNSAAAAV